jgi:hypothetical protein
MRKCPVCNEYTAHDSPTCSNCLTEDFAWSENLQHSVARVKHVRSVSPVMQLSLPFVKSHTNRNYERYRIRLSAFTDSGRLGFELCNIQSFIEQGPTKSLVVELDAVGWAYTWDYLTDIEPERDVYLPPNLPLFALVDTSRFVHVIKYRFPNVQIELLLPPKNHAATRFVLETGFYSNICHIRYNSESFTETEMPGSDDVLIPLTIVGPENNGQLSQVFFDRFRLLAKAGHIEPSKQSPIRQVIMEAAENADTWGGRGYISAFLRQENRGRRGFQYDKSFQPQRETHLFIHVFSIQGSLGSTLGMSEREAAYAVESGTSARLGEFGQGMPFIVNTITQKTSGTVFINSGGFTRILSPDGLGRDFLSVGTDYLPGVHLGVVIPLAKLISTATTRSPMPVTA